VGTDVEEATEKLQHAADSINNWTKQWHIKLNTDKSKHVNFKMAHELQQDEDGVRRKNTSKEKCEQISK